jgi:hypothetical protein
MRKLPHFPTYPRPRRISARLLHLIRHDPFAKFIIAASVRAQMTARQLIQPCFAAALGAVILSACVAPPKQVPVTPAPTAKPTPPPVGWFHPEKGTGPASIVVDLSDQRAYFYKGEELVGESKCSSGKKGFSTPPGDYKVTQKDLNHKSNLYGTIVDGAGGTVKRDADMSKMKLPEGCSFAGAKMPFYLRFHNGYGLHAGKVPNYPASHGCVRLPYFMAENFFKHSVIGTPVTVRE